MNTRRPRKELEDPHNSWNQQLMMATLRFDIAEAESLVTRGADPVNAREPTPFSKGDLLSPLAALLLQGTFTTEAIQMAQFLIDQGASLNDLMALPGSAHFHNGSGNLSGRNSGGSTGGAESSMSGRLGGNSGQRMSFVDGRDQLYLKNYRPLSASSARHSIEGSSAGEAAGGEALGMFHCGFSSALPHTAVEQGTVLHYVVALGDWAHLLQILTIAGQRRPTLPQSLMHEIVLGIMIPPKPSSTEERASSRGRKQNSSVSRQSSRSASRSAVQGGGNEVVHAPRSCLPPLRCVPSPFSPGLRLKVHSSSSITPSSALLNSNPGCCRTLPSGGAVESPTKDGRRSSFHDGKQRVRGSSLSNASDGVTSSRVTLQAEAGLGGSFLPVGKCTSTRDSRKTVTSLASPVILAPPDAVSSSTAHIPSSNPGAGIGFKGLSPRWNVGESFFSSSSSVLDNITVGEHLDLCFDFSIKSSTGLPVADWALQRGDVTSVRLLTFYGAKIDFQRLVNGSQTALARACSTGDLPMVERLLDAGDTLTQISEDGRYTLVHYAVAHPPVLEYLARRGLSLDFENAFGENALHSLIMHGYGRNSENAIRDTPKMQDAAKLAALPLVAVRNYILTPLPTLLGGGGGGGAAGGGGKFTKPGGGRGGGGTKGNTSLMRSELASILAPNPLTGGMGRDDPQRKIRLLRLGGGRDCGTWWSFSLLSTSDMIQHLFDAGANIHGNIPHEECDLRYMMFAEEMTRHRAATLAVLPNSSQAYKKRASLPSPSLMMEEPIPTYDPNQLWFTDNVQFGRKPYRCTPLMCAINAYHPELIRRLIMDYHVDLSRRDSLGASCLHHAAICPHPSVLELLYGCGSQDWNAVDMAGRTPLHYAVFMGNIPAIKVLLRNSAVLAGKPHVHGLTPLHLAVLANEVAAVGLLLRHSDSMVSTATSGVTASTAKPSRRQKSSKSNNTSVGGGASSAASIIVPSVATATASVLGGYSGAGSTIGGGPLSTGRLGGVGGTIEFQMVEVDAEDYVEHCTPLEFAIKYHRDPAIVQLLLQEGRASMQRWSGLPTGGSLLHRAVVDGREDYARLLLENYANPNEPDNEDRTALYLAVDTDAPNVPLIQNLMQADAYPFAQSGTTLSTPLHIASARGNPEVINLLFHERAQTNNISSYSAPSNSFLPPQPPEDALSAPRRQGRGGNAIEGARGGSSVDNGGDNMIPSGANVNSMEKGNVGGWGSPSSFSFSSGPEEQSSGNDVYGGKGFSYPMLSSPLISSVHFFSSDSQARIPLHILCAHTKPAAQKRVLPFIEKLVRSGKAPEMCAAMDAHGRTPLHDACRAAFYEAVCLLLTVDPLLVYRVDANGNTPLHDTVYASIRRYPGFLSPENRSDNEKAFLKSACSDFRGGTASTTPSTLLKEVTSFPEGSGNSKVEEQGEGDEQKAAKNKEPPYSEEEHAERTENIIVLLADVVQRTVPRPLRGFPLINSDVHHFSPSLSLTQQIIRKHLYMNRWEAAPHLMTSNDSSCTPYEDLTIHSVREYLRVCDQYGRTPLLVAGEFGNTVAASTLLRIGKVLPILSKPA